MNMKVHRSEGMISSVEFLGTERHIPQSIYVQNYDTIINGQIVL
jgi:hypothetical protein